MKTEQKYRTLVAKESRENEIAKVPPKRGRVRDPHKRADMNWVDRLEPLDADAAAAALERPGPESYERSDLKLG